MAVVDRLVSAAAQELLRAVITERRDRGRVDEPEHVLGIHDPDGLRGRLQHRGKEILGTDIQFCRVGEGAGHAKSPSTVKSMAGRAAKSEAPGVAWQPQPAPRPPR
jgi:hypothetical protein